NSLDRRFFLTNTSLDAIDSRFQLVDIQAAPESDISSQQNLIWTELHCQKVSNMFHSRVGLYDFPRLFDDGPVSPLAYQQGSTLSSQKNRHRAKKKADED